jgi:hypothetical protein
MIGEGTIRPPITIRPRAYVSNLVVQFEKLAPGKLESIFKAARHLNTLLKERLGRDGEISMARLAFAADPLLLPPHTQTTFILERRAGASYNSNWFWSSAPVEIDDHLLLLEALENDFARI